MTTNTPGQNEEASKVKELCEDVISTPEAAKKQEDKKATAAQAAEKDATLNTPAIQKNGPSSLEKIQGELNQMITSLDELENTIQLARQQPERSQQQQALIIKVKKKEDEIKREYKTLKESMKERLQEGNGENQKIVIDTLLSLSERIADLEENENSQGYTLGAGVGVDVNTGLLNFSAGITIDLIRAGKYLWKLIKGGNAEEIDEKEKAKDLTGKLRILRDELSKKNKEDEEEKTIQNISVEIADLDENTNKLTTEEEEEKEKKEILLRTIEAKLALINGGTLTEANLENIQKEIMKKRKEYENNYGNLPGDLITRIDKAFGSGDKDQNVALELTKKDKKTSKSDLDKCENPDAELLKDIKEVLSEESGTTNGTSTKGKSSTRKINLLPNSDTQLNGLLQGMTVRVGQLPEEILNTEDTEDGRNTFTDAIAEIREQMEEYDELQTTNKAYKPGFAVKKVIGYLEKISEASDEGKEDWKLEALNNVDHAISELTKHADKDTKKALRDSLNKIRDAIRDGKDLDEETKISLKDALKMIKDALKTSSNLSELAKNGSYLTKTGCIWLTGGIIIAAGGVEYQYAPVRNYIGAQFASTRTEDVPGSKAKTPEINTESGRETKKPDAIEKIEGLRYIMAGNNLKILDSKGQACQTAVEFDENGTIIRYKDGENIMKISTDKINFLKVLRKNNVRIITQSKEDPKKCTVYLYKVVGTKLILISSSTKDDPQYTINKDK